MVRVARFERAIFRSQAERDTRLRYTRMKWVKGTESDRMTRDMNPGGFQSSLHKMVDVVCYDQTSSQLQWATITRFVKRPKWPRQKVLSPRILFWRQKSYR